MTVDVAHVTSVHPWNDNRIFMRECRSLAAHGLRVALVARGRDTSSDPPIVDGVTVVGFPSYSGRLRRVLRGLPRMTRTLLDVRATTYHLHDPELVALAPWLRLRGANVVYDAHEDLPMQMLGKHIGLPGGNRLFSVIARGVCWSVGRSCHRVVAATSTVARRFPQSRTRVVRNLPELLTDVDNRFDYPDRSDTVVYVGGISENRGARQMVEAARLALPEPWRLQLVGPANPPGLPETLMTARSTPGISWEGQLPPREARVMMAAAKVGLVVLQPTPAYVDALPTKLFEYMAAGLPVVSSDFPAWREIVEGSGCGLLVDPRRVEEIADALRYLVEHPDEAREMGARGRQAVEESLNWDSEKRELLDLYDGLDPRPSGRPPST